MSVVHLGQINLLETMISHFIWIILVAECFAQTNPDPVKMLENMKATTESCLTSTKTKPEDLKAIWAQEVSESHDINCLMACIMKKTGTMEPDNKVNVIKEKEAIQNNPRSNDLAKVIDKCKSEETVYPDECMAAKKHKECFLKYKKEFNIQDHF